MIATTRRALNDESVPLTDTNQSAEMPNTWTKRPSDHWLERLHSTIVRLLSLVSVMTTVGIIGVLFYETYFLFKEISIVEFFLSTRWSPLIEPRQFGIWPLIAGTFLIAGTALLLAVPVGVLAALFLSEYVKGAVREACKAALEILAGVPTVVYGFFAVVWITPQLEKIFPSIGLFNALSASIVVGIMIIPAIASLSLDSFLMVPRELREAGFGLGARRSVIALTVVLPSALSGVIASIVLAFSRAVGETMAVTLAAGSSPKLTWNLLESVQTMTAFIVQVALGDAPAGSIEYQSIFAVGALLFVITLSANIVAKKIVSRFREGYQ